MGVGQGRVFIQQQSIGALFDRDAEEVKSNP
jgi:hypothetical protein